MYVTMNQTSVLTVLKEFYHACQIITLSDMILIFLFPYDLCTWHCI